MGKIYPLLLASVLLAFCGKQTGLSGVSDDISGEHMTETFAVNVAASDKLDILLVVDGSDSMREERAKIARKLEPLLEYVKERDWQIGIASTDMVSCFAAIINAKTPDYQDVYRQAIDTIKPANAEQAVYMVIRGLRGMPVVDANNTCDDNKPQRLVRENSAIGILIITDEDHQCAEILKQTAAEGCEIQDLYDNIKLRGIPNVTVRVYGFLDETDKFLAWRDESGESVFTRHEPYNTDDYDTLLKAISSDLSAIVQYKYKLQEKHDGEAATVVISDDSGTTRTLGQSEYGIVDKKLFILTTLPTNTSSIEVTYSYQP